MTGAGANLRGFDQQMLDDAMRNYQRQRDFALQQQYAFQNQMLGNAPQSQQVGYTPNNYSPFAAGIGGAMQGAGFGMDMMKLLQDYNNQFGGSMTAGGTSAPGTGGTGP